MKVQSLIRNIVIAAITILLCTGFGIYSFVRLDTAEVHRDFNLYTLVPQDVTAVLETDQIIRFVSDMEQMAGNGGKNILSVSELLVYLKQYMYSVLENTPHGLSQQKSKFLISFHEPGTAVNQVLYCSLKANDYEWVEGLLSKYASSVYPPKNFDYAGKNILIFPMENGRFLSVYLTRHFVVASFQKKLIEKVIDAYRHKKSLMCSAGFQAIYTDKHNSRSATLYARIDSVEMGQDRDSLCLQASLGSWCEFDLKWEESTIYCTGVSHHSDSTSQTFINALCKQQPVTGFPNTNFPASTFSYACWSVSDAPAIFGFTSGLFAMHTDSITFVGNYERDCAAFLSGHMAGTWMSGIFMPADTADTSPCVVAIAPMKNVLSAERQLRSFLYSIPQKGNVPAEWQYTSKYLHYAYSKRLRLYVFPRTNMLAQLTGMVAPIHLFMPAFIEAVC